jgi:hypothetical protein
LHVRTPDPSGPDVDDRGLEGEPDRALRIVTGQADTQWTGPPLVVDHDGQVGVRPVAHANALGFEPDRRGRDRRDGGALHPVSGRLDLVASVGGGHRERPVHLLTGRRYRSTELRGRGAFDAGRHPQLDGPEHEADLLLRVVPDEPHAPFPVARGLSTTTQLGDGAVHGPQRSAPTEPDRHLDRAADVPGSAGDGGVRPLTARP